MVYCCRWPDLRQISGSRPRSNSCKLYLKSSWYDFKKVEAILHKIGQYAATLPLTAPLPGYGGDTVQNAGRWHKLKAHILQYSNINVIDLPVAVATAAPAAKRRMTATCRFHAKKWPTMEMATFRKAMKWIELLIFCLCLTVFIHWQVFTKRFFRSDCNYGVWWYWDTYGCRKRILYNF